MFARFVQREFWANTATLCGALFLVLGVILIGLQVIFLAASVPGTGKVTALTEREDETLVEFTFRDAGGTEHAISTRNPLVAGKFKVDGEINLRYLASTPTFTQIDSFITLWAPPLFCTGLGALALGVAWLLRKRVQPRTQA